MIRLIILLLSLVAVSSCSPRHGCIENDKILSIDGMDRKLAEVVGEQLAEGELSRSNSIRSLPGLIGNYSVKLDEKFEMLGMAGMEERVITSTNGDIVAVFFARSQLNGIIVYLIDPSQSDSVPSEIMKFKSDRVAAICIKRD